MGPPFGRLRGVGQVGRRFRRSCRVAFDGNQLRRGCGRWAAEVSAVGGGSAPVSRLLPTHSWNLLMRRESHPPGASFHVKHRPPSRCSRGRCLSQRSPLPAKPRGNGRRLADRPSVGAAATIAPTRASQHRLLAGTPRCGWPARRDAASPHATMRQARLAAIARRRACQDRAEAGW